MSRQRKPRIQPVFRADRTGIARALGDLETRIVETLWRLGNAVTVTDVQKSMGGDPRAYHTVTTVMVRLCRKGLVRRKRRGGVWHYETVLSRDEFRGQVAHEVISGVYSLAPEAAINSMVNVVEAQDPKGLDALAKLIEQKRRQRGR